MSRHSHRHHAPSRARAGRAAIVVLAVAVPLLSTPVFTTSAAQTAPATASTPPPFAITNARIVDGTGKAPFEGTVLVRDGRIAAVGPDVAVPAGVRTIDGRGRTVTPGLFDLHVHLSGGAGHPLATDVTKHLAAYLYCGVTSIAELGTAPENFDAFRQMVEPGRQMLASGVQAPHVSLAARVAVPGGHGVEGGRADLHTAQVATPADARAAMTRIAAHRPDLIKVFTDGWRYGAAPNLASMIPETLSAVTAAARTQRIPVITHTVTMQGAREAAESGVTIQGHGIGDGDVDAALASLIRERGMAYVSTLSVYEPRDHRKTTPLLWKVVEPAFRARLEGSAPRPRAITVQTAAAAPEPAGDRVSAARQRRWTRLTHNVKALHDAGVRIGVGTDAGVSGAPHGWSTLLELRLLVEAGLTPLEALTAGTGHGAAALGVAADRGTIAPGQRADLLLVPGDPTTDVALMERVERVFLDGREIDRPALEAMMTSPDFTPRPAVPVTTPLIDDFEGPDLRSDRGSIWMNATEAGPHPTRMVYSRVLRTQDDRALHVSASLSDAASPYAQVTLDLVRGGLQPADVSTFTGLRFDVRGEGDYRVILGTRGVRDRRFHEAPFTGSATWTPVSIPFARLTQPGDGTPVPWTGRDLMEIAFELARDPGTTGWLEIDNIRLY